MILCVGEILADMIGSVKDGQTVYARKAGGAPFNVACAAKQFGAHSAFVGSVGDDLIGTFLEDFARERGLDELLIRRDPQRNTTLAFVQLDEHGDRSFCFYRKNTADYHLPEVPDELLDRAHIVHVELHHGAEGHAAGPGPLFQELLLVGLGVLLPGKAPLFLLHRARRSSFSPHTEKKKRGVQFNKRDGSASNPGRLPPQRRFGAQPPAGRLLARR